jgi:hypothetical protein
MKLRNKKTGEIEKLWYGNINLNFGDHNEVYYSLAELNADWEDYASAEPLIKDEKIRKAVREWAWANNIDEIDHWQGQLTGRKAGCSRGRAKIQFNRALGFNYGCGFTIAELCGEEEE